MTGAYLVVRTQRRPYFERSPRRTAPSSASGLTRRSCSEKLFEHDEVATDLATQLSGARWQSEGLAGRPEEKVQIDQACSTRTGTAWDACSALQSRSLSRFLARDMALLSRVTNGAHCQLERNDCRTNLQTVCKWAVTKSWNGPEWALIFRKNLVGAPRFELGTPSPPGRGN